MRSDIISMYRRLRDLSWSSYDGAASVISTGLASRCGSLTPASSHLRGSVGLGRGPRLLLVLPNPPQRLLVGDVGDRLVGVVVAVRPGRLPPAVRPHAEPLAEQGDEDARLLLAEPGQRLHPAQQVLAAGGLPPHPLGVTA